MTLAPGQVGSTATVEGEARIYTPSRSMTSGHLLSACVVPNPNGAADFLEKSTGTFFFRIAKDRVNLVRPTELTGGERRRLEAYYRELKRAGAE